MKYSTIPPSSAQKVSINGQSYELIAFYYPDYDTSWDKIYHGQFLANFYPCQLTITIGGISGTFHTAEAAFQATKWWYNNADRKKFEQAKTGDEAYKIKKKLHHADYSYAGLGRDGAMKEVLLAKFSDSDFKNALLLTNDAYLLEHNAKEGRDLYWSDNHIGDGKNMLGITLMDVRAHYGGKQQPSGSYTIADFTSQVEV